MGGLCQSRHRVCPCLDGGKDAVRLKTGDGDLLPLKGDIIEFPGCCMALEGDTETIL